MRCLIGDSRHFEGARFQSLVKKYEAVSIPPHRFDAITPFVDEQKQMAIQHAGLKHRRDDTGKSIKALGNPPAAYRSRSADVLETSACRILHDTTIMIKVMRGRDGNATR